MIEYLYIHAEGKNRTNLWQHLIKNRGQVTDIGTNVLKSIKYWR